MFRAFSSLTVIAFVAWVLPLGAFIKPSQEKTACDGKRAFHMCSMMAKARTDASPKAVSFGNSAAGEQSAKSTGSGSDDFAAAIISFVFTNTFKYLPENLVFLPPHPIPYLLEAVPKI